MKQTLLLIFCLVGALALQAQTPDVSAIKALIERVSPKVRAEVKPHSGREVLSCTQETNFNANLSSPSAWDSTFRYITRIDEENGYRILTQESYAYDAVANFELETRTTVYGVDDQGTFERGFDSLVQVVPDNGNLLVYVKIYPFYTASNKLERLDIYFNTAAFGLPLGFILFGQNLFYYDQNDFLIATASKEVDFLTFGLINADTTAFVNNIVGQVLEQTDWQWDPDFQVYEPTYRYTNAYVSVGGDLQSEIIETWNGNDWEYISRNLYSYTKPSQVSSQAIQIGTPGNWTTVQDIAYSYDLQDRVVLELESNVAPNGAKTPSFRTLYTYDTPQGWLEESIGQYNELGVWINSFRAIIEDCAGPVSVDEPRVDHTVRAWFNSARQLELQLSTGAEARLVEVFDLAGRPVLVAIPAAHDQAIDAARLQQGLYLIRVTLTNGTTSTQKAVQW